MYIHLPKAWASITDEQSAMPKTQYTVSQCTCEVLSGSTQTHTYMYTQ